MYRFFKGAPTDHFYTTGVAEGNIAVGSLGYGREGIAFYCSPTANYCGATKPLHRYLRQSDHFYTTDSHEGNANVIALGGKYEGVACYIWP
jgi:hypothetical protein